MNVSLTKELEKVVEEKVNSGFYNNASEVVRDALRRAFTEIPGPDLELDTPELAALVQQGRRSRHVLHKKGDIRKVLAKVRSRFGQ
ncbi:MAG: type II toxin-antitoxin system ParD family antitoxin [Verrucomicrobiota bacterium]|jgi:antitoxin ParD1/3/4